MSVSKPIIVHFLSCTGHGGDALHALALARGQRESGCDAQLLIGSSEHSERFLERAAEAGVPAEEVHGLPLIEHIATWRRILLLRSALVKHRPDVVHLHTGSLVVRAAEVLGARLTPARLRVATVQWPTGWEAGSEAGQAQWKKMARMLDKVIAPSSISRETQLAAGLPPPQVVALANTVDVDRIRAGDGAKIRAEFQIGTGDPLILFLARMEDQKRPLDALQAFARVAPQFPRARMLFVGNGVQEDACREEIANLGLSARVTVTGYRTDVADFMRAADIYLLPTLSESFGITLGEAMAAGAAVVTSKIAPLVGEVVPEDCGLFAAPGDVDGFADALRRLLADPAERARRAARGARIVEEMFSAQATARDHIALYNQLLSSRRRTLLQAFDNPMPA